MSSDKDNEYKCKPLSLDIKKRIMTIVMINILSVSTIGVNKHTLLYWVALVLVNCITYIEMY